MTICITWADDQGLGVLADSAVTTRATDEPSRLTSIGQRGDFGRYKVTESALKVYQLSVDAVFTAAGDGQAIEAVAQIMRTAISLGVREAIRIAQQSVGGADYEAVVATAAAGRHELLRFSSTGVVEATQGVVVLGNSAAIDHDDLRGFVRPLSRAGYKPMEVLAAVCGFVVSKAAHEPSVFAGGVGGALFGGVFHDGRWKWQDDLVVMYLNGHTLDALRGRVQMEDALLDLVWFMVRDGVGVSASSFRAKGKGVRGVTDLHLFQNSLSPPLEDWAARHGSSIEDGLRYTDRVVLVNTSRIDNIGIYSGAAVPDSFIRIRMMPEGVRILMTEGAVDWLEQTLELDRKLYAYRYPPEAKE